MADRIIEDDTGNFLTTDADEFLVTDDTTSSPETVTTFSLNRSRQQHIYSQGAWTYGG